MRFCTPERKFQDVKIHPQKNVEKYDRNVSMRNDPLNMRNIYASCGAATQSTTNRLLLKVRGHRNSGSRKGKISKHFKKSTFGQTQESGENPPPRGNALEIMVWSTLTHRDTAPAPLRRGGGSLRPRKEARPLAEFVKSRYLAWRT